MAGLVMLSQPGRAENAKDQAGDKPVDPMAWARVSKEQETAAAKLGVPVALTNSVGMRFVLIPAGKFEMGSQDSVETVHDKCIGVDVNPDWATDEHPVHEVKISQPFYMSIYEVDGKRLETLAPRPNETKEQQQANNQRRRGNDQNKPAVNVWWEEAVQFCEELGKKNGHSYRLPTEAEWEYACRAGTTTPFSFGETVFTNQVNCNHYFPYSEKGRAAPTFQAGAPVACGSYPPNAWGLHDMHGNVSEWCADWYAPYTAKSLTDPVGPDTGTQRVVRGGASHNSPAVCRSAKRIAYAPRASGVGFRVVMELKK